MTGGMSRRQWLKASAGAGFGVMLAGCTERDCEANPVSISASPDTAGAAASVHSVEAPIGSTLDGESVSDVMVAYDGDFDADDVEPGDVRRSGFEEPDGTFTSEPVTEVNDAGGLGFTFGNDLSLADGGKVVLEYGDVTNPTAADDYTVYVVMNETECSNTLTVTPEPASDFASGDDGWRVVNAQGLSNVPDHETNEGNPAPSISARDNVSGHTTNFVAPDKFLGDMSAFYGGTLNYDLMQEYSKDTNQFSAPDVRLRSGGTTLKYDHGGTSTHPGGGSSGVWTSYTVRLDESAAWKVKNQGGDDTPATESQIQAVLGDLHDIRIRGEFNVKVDWGYLDNVEIRM